jgi:hypothetical protein
VDYKDISERIALLTQEIRNLQEMNARYCKESEHTRRISRAAHEARALRLLQIKDDLSRMMAKRTASATQPITFEKAIPPTIGAVSAGEGGATT